MHLAIGILTAIIDRNRTGKGQKVSVSMQDAVLNLCREHALASREPYGVWGGMTEDERVRIINPRELAS